MNTSVEFFRENSFPLEGPKGSRLETSVFATHEQWEEAQTALVVMAENTIGRLLNGDGSDYGNLIHVLKSNYQRIEDTIYNDNIWPTFNCWARPGCKRQVFLANAAGHILVYGNQEHDPRFCPADTRTTVAGLERVPMNTQGNPVQDPEYFREPEQQERAFTEEEIAEMNQLAGVGPSLPLEERNIQGAMEQMDQSVRGMNPGGRRGRGRGRSNNN